MLRHILHDLEWGITLVIVTLVLYLIIFLLTTKPAIAAVTETDITPGQINCRLERVLADDAGHKRSVMFVTEVDSPEGTSSNVRLSGLYS